MTSKFVNDTYSGFDDYDHAYDVQHLKDDSFFQEAIARSSHGRRPESRMVTGNNRLVTSSFRLDQSISRPMTAVKGVGYSSKVEADETKLVKEKNEDGIESKIIEGEEKVMQLVKESVILRNEGNFKAALDKAKESGRKERYINKLRDDNNKRDNVNVDMTFCVLFNLAQQYESNDLSTEALNTYTVMIKDKTFVNSGRLKVNMGNIHFKRKEYNKAIKYYRMALDQVPSVQKTYRMGILKNIGISFIKMGRYEEGSISLEQCVEERSDSSSLFNLVLSMYCLEDGEKMRDAFIRMLEMNIPTDDDTKEKDRFVKQLVAGDTLSQYIRSKVLSSERSILTAARIISPSITDDSSSGYEWCIEMIKQSNFAYLATELEMNKVVYLMREGKLNEASNALASFSSAEPKIASASAANQSILEWMKGNKSGALEHVEISLSLDRYNTSALVTAGIVSFEEGNTEGAIIHMQEALENDALCMAALYNLGLINKRTHRMENALEWFYKLNNMLRNNVQVLCQLASIYEFMEDSGQAIELYSQANSLAPTDTSILAKLSNIYESEGDKTQAFQCYYDSYRYLPSNMAVIEWIAAYYLEAQFAEKAVSYFEKASILQPNEIKWHMMIASCHRRSGNYHKAFELYKNIHNKFPSNLDCLKFLVRIASDLNMPETQEYMSRLQKAERVRQLRIQRDTDSAHGKTTSAASIHSLPIPTNERPHSLTVQRQLSAQLNLERPYRSATRDMNSTDLSYADPVGRVERPKTGMKKERKDREDSFDDLDESFLPM